MNKYLEKLALNRFERHLAEQPKGKTYADPRINQAKTKIDLSMQQRGMADNWKFLGKVEGLNSNTVNDEIANHTRNADNLIKGIRGNSKGLNQIHRDSPKSIPFANTGDSLASNSYNRQFRGARVAPRDMSIKTRRWDVKKERGERIRALNQDLSQKAQAKAREQATAAGTGQPKQTVNTAKAMDNLSKAEARSKFNSASFGQKVKILVSKALGTVKRNPGKTALIGAGVVGAGYGVKKLTEK